MTKWSPWSTQLLVICKQQRLKECSTTAVNSNSQQQVNKPNATPWRRRDKPPIVCYNCGNPGHIAKGYEQEESNECVATLSVYPHRARLKNMPGHGGIRTYDLWNASPTLYQLSDAVRSVRVCDISELSLVPSISM